MENHTSHRKAFVVGDMQNDYRKRARKAPCFSKGMQSASAEGGFEVNSDT
jgi:hypothetical protein